MRQRVTVYFDYLCPFVWRAAEVVEMIADELELDFRWHHFSLYQSNYNGDGNWQVWNDPLEPECTSGGKGLLPFLASCAVRRQGEDVHHRFRLALLRERHQYHRPLSLETILEVACQAQVDMNRFRGDLADPECRTVLAHEHTKAKALDVFGTPTFHFPGGDLAYFRIKELPRDADEALMLFVRYRELLERFPYLETIKRPRAKGN
jgi:predicted DsbA family dithiol-disulfide isomerase